jgi:hypothetical protein
MMDQEQRLFPSSSPQPLNHHTKLNEKTIRKQQEDSERTEIVIDGTVNDDCRKQIGFLKILKSKTSKTKSAVPSFIILSLDVPSTLVPCPFTLSPFGSILDGGGDAVLSDRRWLLVGKIAVVTVGDDRWWLDHCRKRIQFAGAVFSCAIHPAIESPSLVKNQWGGQ